MQRCSRRVCQRTPTKVLIYQKSGQYPRKPEQKWRAKLFDFKKCLPTFPEKHKDLFRKVTLRKGLHDLCGRRQKSHKTFRASLGKFGKKSFAPPKMCLLYTYAGIFHLQPILFKMMYQKILLVKMCIFFYLTIADVPVFSDDVTGVTVKYIKVLVVLQTQTLF